MKNKNLVLGIAAGVAALAVVGIICNKKGYINFGSILDKAGDIAGNIKDSLGNLKDKAVTEAGNVIKDSQNIAGKALDSASGIADKTANVINN